MADLELRDLERALSGGDESVCSALAAQYLRHGRTCEALALMGRFEGIDPELLGEEQALWRRELQRLELTQPIEVKPLFRLQRLGRPLDWFDDGRYLAFRSPPRGPLRVYSRAEGRVETVIEGAPAVAVTRRGVLCRRGQEWVRVRRNGHGWDVDELELPAYDPGRSFTFHSIHPEGTHALFTRLERGRIQCVVFEVDTRRRCRELEGYPLAVDWLRDRGVWRRGPETNCQTGSLTGREKVRQIRLDVQGVSTIFTRFLRDGRFLVTHPPAVIDIEAGETLRGAFEGNPEDLADLRLAVDGQALLASERAQPIRIPLVPLEGELEQVPALTEMRSWPPVAWHPRADIALHRDTDPQGFAAGWVVRAVGGDVLLRLPDDARGLAWTPDGLGLIVGRTTEGPGDDRLELWRVSSP